MNFIKELLVYILIIILVVLVRVFLITPVRVDGVSMYPTLENGEILLLNKFDKKYERFDIVVFNYSGSKLIKRIIGLPGEHIKFVNNELYVNGKVVKDVEKIESTLDYDIKQLDYDKIPENMYFLVGDNRANSTDSRLIGPISENEIVGKVDVVLFPFNKIRKIG